MGWTIATLGIALALANAEIGLFVFVVGLIVTILNNTASGKPPPAPAKSAGALIMLIFGAIAFMMAMAAVVGAAGSF